MKFVLLKPGGGIDVLEEKAIVLPKNFSADDWVKSSKVFNCQTKDDKSVAQIVFLAEEGASQLGSLMRRVVHVVEKKILGHVKFKAILA